MREESLAKAREIVSTSLVWDNHACMPLRPDDDRFLPELQLVRRSGVDVISLNVGFGPQGPDEHLAMLDSFTTWLRERPAEYLLIHSAADIEAARNSGRLGVFFDVEGMFPLDGGRLDLVETFRSKGVGWMLVAYNRNNQSGGGCADDDCGLTDYGRAVIEEMNRVGMIICCSHTGHRTAMQVLEAAAGPVIFSHSNALALCDHYRNIPDALIRACAQTGGVVGINGLGTFLGQNDASAGRVAEHIDHAVQLVGADHVGIGLDYVFDKKELEDFLATMSETFPDDHSFKQPINMLHPQYIVEIVASLIERGYQLTDLRKILSANWLRVAQQVWK
jgi:membrane dipeptidase